MTAVHLIVTSFQVFSPPTPGPPVSVLLCCFKICMSLRNASHGSKLCVSQPPTWWNDPFKAGSICLNLHSSSFSKASGFGTQPRNILIKAHYYGLFLALRKKWLDQVKLCHRRMDEDSWQKKQKKKSKVHFDALSLPLSIHLLLSRFPLSVCVSVCVRVPFAQCSCVFLGLKRIKPGGVSEKEREKSERKGRRDVYIRKKWKRMEVCLCLCGSVYTHV